jgi:hypothetical protein
VPKHKFQFSVDGSGLAPDNVRVNDLIELLRAFESAVSATAEMNAKSVESLDLFLVGVRDDGAALDLEIGDYGYNAAAICARAVTTGDMSIIPQKARIGLLSIQKRACDHKWTVSWGDGNGMPIAVIAPDKELFSNVVVRGTTSLAGAIDRVGGSEFPTAKIVLNNGGQITASVESKTLASRIGELLYDDVIVIGEATWSANDWSLLDFKITDVKPLDKNTDVLDTITALSNIAGDFWNGIDPDDYIEQLRADSL